MLTTGDVDDALQVGPLLDHVEGLAASGIAEGAYDQDSVCSQAAAHYAEVSVIVPPRSSAVPSERAETTPTMRCAFQRLQPATPSETSYLFRSKPAGSFDDPSRVAARVASE